ncbi:SUR7/PalI family-domain-containing protein [Xylariaceae sp. FL0016]|nr:SUR7/PalI family-domain-containing protein [Xylariaceae sp. FL0016]
MAFARFRKNKSESTATEPDREKNTTGLDNATIKSGTKTRRHAIWVASFCYLVAWVFLILVEIGNTSKSKVPGDIYFFKLDLADIFPQSVPTSFTLQNSIARTLGLHDFYQVGLWSFCEGYVTDGITYCSKPTALFWFNPVEILLSELFTGASIALPSEVNDVLYILRIASHIMFGFFITGLLLDVILMLASPIAIFSRWWSLPMSLFSFIAALLVTVAAILGTAMSLIFKYALSSQPDLGVSASVGTKMLVFMWIATACNLIAFFIHAGMGCCCTSKRDMRTGRKNGRKLNNGDSQAPAGTEEKKGFSLPKFGKKSQASS